MRLLGISYAPDASDRSFEARAEKQSSTDLDVATAALDRNESRKFFGVPMARRGIQPVWVRVNNRGPVPYRLSLVSLDPSYYTPLEAAAANHFSSWKRLLGLGALAWLFLPLLILLPFKLIAAWRANRRIDAHFQAHAFKLRPVWPGCEAAGFVFTPLDAGTKSVRIRLLGPQREQQFTFSIQVAGLDADYLRRDFEDAYPAGDLVDCDVATLRQRLRATPRATTNRPGSHEGDPVNLIVIGEFQTVLSAFGARWDECEVITLATCWKTARSFLFGAEYRYSPVSPLFLFGRSQDFALQRIRESVHERLHLRLWATPMRLEGRPVWIGQVSRDIGVRFTWKTWNLSTHRIDPDVDEAREYVLEDLLEAGRVESAGYVDGVGACTAASPRRNLTGDPYFTDGNRIAIAVSAARTTPRFVAWQ